MFPSFHIDVPEAVTIRDPEGLPVATPSGQSPYTGQRRCCSHSRQKEGKGQQEKCAHARPSCRKTACHFRKKKFESITTQTCGARDTCKQGRQGQASHLLQYWAVTTWSEKKKTRSTWVRPGETQHLVSRCTRPRTKWHIRNHGAVKITHKELWIFPPSCTKKGRGL